MEDFSKMDTIDIEKKYVRLSKELESLVSLSKAYSASLGIPFAFIYPAYVIWYLFNLAFYVESWING